MSSAAVNLGVHVSLWIIVLSGYMPRSGIARSYGNSEFFWGTSILFSIVTASAYIATNTVGGFPFLHTLSSICYLRLFFNDDHSHRCEVVSHCTFDLHFSKKEQGWASFHVLIWLSYVFFGGISIKVLYPFFDWLIYFCCCQVVWAICIFWRQTWH